MKRLEQENLLVELAHHRWSIPIIALLQRDSGAKFVTLSKRLDVSRSSLRTSLDHLIQLGLICKNEGHGHPMRPEYLLTQTGLNIGTNCAALVRIVERRDEADTAFRKWSLPLVAAIGEESLRFNQLRAILVDASPRAITIGLKSLIQARWASRVLLDQYPPAAGYSLRPKGLTILGKLQPFC